MNRFPLLSLLLLGLPLAALAQPAADSETDSTRKQVDLGEVVVTATRTPSPLINLPVPATIVTRQQLEQMGSQRLNEALLEQTGMAIVPATIGNGLGVQLQGLDPAYTLILVDGEPLVGREAGTLDLSRITVGMIERIEIIRGPASSLYGSEALGGVVNIITRRSTDPLRLDSRVRYGSNNTLDANLQVGVTQGAFSSTFYGNHFRTDGYSLLPGGTTQPPRHNTTVGGRLSYLLGSRTTLAVTGRVFDQTLTDNYPSTLGQLREEQTLREYSVNPSITHFFSDAVKLRLHYYETRFDQRANVSVEATGAPYENWLFDHTFRRPELQADWTLAPGHTVIAGGGAVFERLQRSFFPGVRTQQQGYSFAQYEWTPKPRLTVLAGLRYDENSVFGSALSPKLAVQVPATRWLRVQASYGQGFKAPDFRQLYFNFTNPAGGGYSVLGSEELGNFIALREAQGIAYTRFADFERVGGLRPERSQGFNLGLMMTPAQRVTLNINAFRNDVRNLIDTRPVAIETANPTRQVFSYLNLDRVILQGIEIQNDWQVVRSSRHHLDIGLGYQLLDAYNPDEWQRVQDGAVRRNQQTGRVERIEASSGIWGRLTGDYAGLPNRSRHSGTAKLSYSYQPWDLNVNLRTILRGPYGFADQDGNLLITTDEYAPGYVIGNLALTKGLQVAQTQVRLQAGVDNLFNFTDPTRAPAFAGRLFWGAVSFAWAKADR